MLFSDDDEKLLKTWLERRLSKISDAEAPILAEYCIALLRHDQSEAEVHALCVEQLKDFLKGDTKSFVDDVFQTIKARSYVSVNSKLSTTSIPKVHGIIDNKATPQRTAIPDSNKNIASDPQQFPGLPPMPMPPAEMMMDPKFMQYMQMQMQMPLQEPSAPNGRKKKHCFAFQKSGFCSRGAACPYEHISPAAPAVQQRNFHEYDPSFSAMSSGPQNISQSDQDRQTSRDRGSKELRHKGPQRDKTKSSLVVENVPEDRLDEESVRRFFEKFGRVDNIDIQRKERRVILKFRDWDTAQSAYTSPGAIFDNRFVKVFWLQERNTGGRPEGRPSNRSTRHASETTMDLQHDPVTLAAKQREHEARLQKKLEMERRALELSAQKASLERRQMEGRSLMQRMQDTNVMEEQQQQQQQPPDSRVALQAQLDTLKAQATALGITPDEVAPGPRAHPPAYRGRGRGRGGFPPGARPAPYGRPAPRKTLDLRPRTIRLTGLRRPPAEVEREVRRDTPAPVTVERHGDDGGMDVTFETRYEAEAFSVRGQALGEMAWVRTPTTNIGTGAAATTTTTTDRHDAEGDVDVDDFDRDRYDD